MASIELLTRVFKVARGVNTSVRLYRKDNTTMERLQKSLATLKTGKQPIVKAGFIAGPKTVRKAEEQATKKGKKQKSPSNVQVAVWNEFGTRDIPARPFVGAAFRKHQNEYRAALRKLVEVQVVPGRRSIEQVLGLMGAKMAADIKKFVTVGPQVPPPNSDRVRLKKQALTKRRRGESKKKFEARKQNTRTLVDTGQMINSATWAVET